MFEAVGAEADALEAGRIVVRRVADGQSATGVEGLAGVLEHLLRVADGWSDRALRAEVLVARGCGAYEAGSGQAAADDLTAALAAAKEIGSVWHANLVLGWLAQVCAQGVEAPWLGDELDAAIRALPTEAAPGQEFETLVRTGYSLGIGAIGIGRSDSATVAAEKLLIATRYGDGAWAAESLIRRIAEAGRSDEAVLKRLSEMLTRVLDSLPDHSAGLRLMATFADVAPEAAIALGLSDRMAGALSPEASPADRTQVALAALRLAVTTKDSLRVSDALERAVDAAMALEDPEERLDTLDQLEGRLGEAALLSKFHNAADDSILG